MGLLWVRQVIALSCWRSFRLLTSDLSVCVRLRLRIVDQTIARWLQFITVTVSCRHFFGLQVIPGLKPPFSANPSYRSLPFLLQDWLHRFLTDCLPIRLSISVFYVILFLFFFHILLVGSVRYIKLTRVGFWLHFRIASRIVIIVIIDRLRWYERCYTTSWSLHRRPQDFG